VAAGGGGISKLQYTVGYFAFMGFLIFISNQSGLLFINGSITPPPVPNIIDVVGNISYFFSALLISSDYQLLYILIISPLTIGLFVCIYEWVRGI
jgi:hypothetical protein